ncbi:aldehyde dehydrogenase family protein [Rhodococcus fascians]|nr:aldehyde dehydrogenase family protein [Rhodococcus fascians]MBY4140937.1 aldehyde dehydrogenase family protein [Rhodococcus fascians]MBY4219601.1 aldehyde dehydrogenase family protein [Rhodococcus fascians]MBY4221910.1 aldehyde dehydrogenase family protein [Rhodococcus fascians]MBY4233911.1 aldehyde dehydrogenase family protein [Rhodococcus fascians]
MKPEYLMLIDGALVPASNGSVFDNINPADETVIGTVPDATADDVAQAIVAARRAFDTTSWSTDHELRRRCLQQLRAGLEKNAELLRPMIVAETGAPIFTTYGVQLDQCIGFIGHYVDLLESYEFEKDLPDKVGEDLPTRRFVRKEAAGVVAAITPWNVPLYLNICKVAAALAAGCTVVLKPAPDTPYSALALGEIVHAHTDIPAGVFNVVTPSDNEVGALLTSHPDVDAVTFTGSTATGRRIMAAAAPTVKRVTLELGGKSAAIVLDDADLETVVPSVAGGLCYHAGQGCAALTRLLVPRSRFDEAVALAKATMQNIPWGDPNDPNNIMGPVANKRQHESVLRYYDLARESGTLVVGGNRPADGTKGFWVEPTLVAGIDENSEIAQEEVFGPLLAILAFDDDDDAVRMANNSVYGLSGAVYSSDTDRALAVASRIRTGTVGVNGAQWFDPNSPFGGYKQSGLGREWGTEGLDDFLEVKTIAVPYATQPA